MTDRIMFGKNNSRARVTKSGNDASYKIEVRAFGHWTLIDRRNYLKPARALAQRLEEAFHTVKVTS